MAGNSFGNIFKLSTFGESHGKALGGVIDGCPAGVNIDLDFINSELKRRRPGQSEIVTQRKEDDSVEFLSGIFEGKSTGTPIGFIIANQDQKSKDYSHIKDSYRPSHADFVYDKKYGFRDYRGGGRSSARETVVRVVAGAIAKLILKEVKINAFVSSVGKIKYQYENSNIDFENIEKSIVRCPDLDKSKEMEDLKEEIKSLRNKNTEISKKEAEATLARLHPDFNTIRESDEFHQWADSQPEEIKGWIYSNATNATLASRAIDLFKQDVGKLKSKDEVSGDLVPASEMIDIFFLFSSN